MSSSVISLDSPNILTWSKSAILSRIPPAEFFAIEYSAPSEILIFSLSDIYLRCFAISSVVILLKSNL